MRRAWATPPGDVSRRVTKAACNRHIPPLSPQTGLLAWDFPSMARAAMAKTTHSMRNYKKSGARGSAGGPKRPMLREGAGTAGPFAGFGAPGAAGRCDRASATRSREPAAVACRRASPTTIKKMVRRRLLEPEYSGVYAVAYAPPVPLARETAALLACHGRAVLSHRSAAALWDLLPPVDAPVEVTVVRGESGRKRAGLRLHRASLLAERDTSTYQSLPVTSPARTLLDIASCASERLVECALDEAIRRQENRRSRRS